MSLKKEIAATIRVVRSVRGLAYEDLASVTARTNVSALERGKINITVDKLIELAAPLKLDPVTLLAISISLSNGESPEAALERARGELESFRSEGGLDLLATQIVDDTLVQRSRGKPEGSKNAQAIQELKAAGFSRKDVMEKLGLSRSTVYGHWKI
ncbi:helix-turn-helix domain-containing protein [Pseudomonas sp. PD9R]|jgi:transcriptional regulator with XRE-family HTH domain|uniref:helix-turn-helix domain-containing protein n=1 Tax=Pseudomonas sp. PD9R TaxID=2853534 RepID=UPI001C47E66A|nr:helix-turn-helix domain-containing protein [Pseudomonas sp. PD9R]MBV6824519.1 helix-turn-helix domain containing protein [Pseudomonas sp. PD9R]